MKTSIIPLCQQGIFIWQAKCLCRRKYSEIKASFLLFICVATSLFIIWWAATVFRSPVLETWTQLAVLFFNQPSYDVCMTSWNIVPQTSLLSMPKPIYGIVFELGFLWNCAKITRLYLDSKCFLLNIFFWQ